MDAKSLEIMKFLYPDLRTRIFRVKEDVYQATRLVIRVTQGWRSYAEQEAIYNQGRTTPGKIVTNAPPGMSWHQFGLAFDVCFSGADAYLERLTKKDAAEKWEWFAKSCENHGVSPGARFRVRPDKPHGELTYGMKLPEAIELYKSGGLAGVWCVVDGFRGVPAMGEWKPDLLPRENTHVG